ncbi:GerAB/ArcD/ProY family transporter [Ammoniphilus sp. 3BR4]|uniref:GerAB/ArcD/ProY family transporter n=1 Tax=Ammoniphilus sp. 3BR4 TaxID=3158265 RepID=UPI003466F819
MDKGKMNKLNNYHVIFLVQNVMIGIGLLSFPHSMSPLGYDLWWMPVVYGFIAQISLAFMVHVGLTFPGQSLYEINESLFGAWIGRILNICIMFYGLIEVAAVCETYLRLMQTISLPDYTITLPLIAFFTVMIYTVLGGIKLIARLCILTFFITGWMAYYLQWGIQKGFISHLLPLFHLDFTFTDWWLAAKASFPTLFGFELILFYFPYIQHPKQALKLASLGLWISVTFYVAVSTVSVLYFSKWQLDNILYPILNLFKAVELSFIERIENLGLALWVMLVLSTSTAYLWLAKKGLDRIRMKNRAWHIYACAAVPFFFIQGPIAYEIRQKVYLEFTLYLGFALMTWPVLILLIHRIKKGGTKNE